MAVSQRLIVARLAVIGLCCGTIGVSMPPVVDAWYGTVVSDITAQAYQSSVDQLNAAQKKKLVEGAGNYNAELAKGASTSGRTQGTRQDALLTDPWTNEAAANSPEHTKYMGALNVPHGQAAGADTGTDDSGDGVAMGPLGRIRIPKIDVDLPIRHDATHASMNGGAGHMYGTSLPVGGPSTHSVIAAHTGARRIYFDRLTELVRGDYFLIDSINGTLKYQVTGTDLVPDTDLSSIRIQKGKDLVTLVTCHPGPDGSNWRLLVHGSRVPTGPNDGPTKSSPTVTMAAQQVAQAADQAARTHTGGSTGTSVAGASHAEVAAQTSLAIQQAAEPVDLSVVDALVRNPAVSGPALWKAVSAPMPTWMLLRVASSAAALLLIFVSLIQLAREVRRGHAE